MISIIIPAYRADKYIDECLESIFTQKADYEVIVGVDACQSTLNSLEKYIDRVRVFYFEENVGPYIIKNTLSEEAKYDKILFFDADDIMVDGLIEKVDKLLDSNDYIKLNYINFRNKINPKELIRNDATTAIKKDVFNSLNGFYPWKCAADSEFDRRVMYNNYKVGRMIGVSFYRRLHDTNLTLSKDTGYNSLLRNHYISLINSRKNRGVNPENKTIYANYKESKGGVENTPSSDNRK